MQHDRLCDLKTSEPPRAQQLEKGNALHSSMRPRIGCVWCSPTQPRQTRSIKLNGTLRRARWFMHTSCGFLGEHWKSSGERRPFHVAHVLRMAPTLETCMYIK
eukprot:CAMPEP_0176294050 /NCGR_PEP_ID=MMETSP0121_2-20121125/56939_1 /TAXON_ID=160619 /ORGANISM="Kryptoperidinium foliaceum, Strain CCMP 1326" /LENGTH=102 /DNA_ID=CAMNT_0017635061 /DNA_START=49 /DNA_END=354 /DNA_ORIENTATION=+